MCLLIKTFRFCSHSPLFHYLVLLLIKKCLSIIELQNYRMMKLTKNGYANAYMCLVVASCFCVCCIVEVISNVFFEPLVI